MLLADANLILCYNGLMGGYRFMKKLFLYIISIMLILTSCSKPTDKQLPPSKPSTVNEGKEKTAEETPVSTVNSDDRIKAVSLLGNKNLDVKTFKSDGFNTILLSLDGIRISKSPYRTDNNALSNLKESIKEIEQQRMNYIIDIGSGPGISSDGKVVSIFDNRQEAMYFARMTKEMINRYEKSTYFKGIAINIGKANVSEEKYYDTLNYIIAKVREEYKDIPIIITLHPLAFENNFKVLPDIKYENVALNASILLNGISYPGYGAGVKTSVKLNKNTMLSALQKLKTLAEDKDLNIIVTARVPWIAKSEVLIQDIFEVTKILDYDFNLCYGNSGDIFDFTQNTSISKIVKRHSE
jgi:hypothetical protein